MKPYKAVCALECGLLVCSLAISSRSRFSIVIAVFNYFCVCCDVHLLAVDDVGGKYGCCSCGKSIAIYKKARQNRVKPV